VRTANPMPTVVRGILHLPGSSVERRASSVLLDAAGREVMELHAGANDVSGLAPGVYFVRAVSRARGAAAQPHESAAGCSKVMIVR
jgi:hypothetical protein